MQKKIRIGINAFWFLIITYLSFRMPLFVDDFFQSKSFATGEEINSITMLFESLKVSYQTFNGRCITMFLIQLMLNLPRIVFSLCNALVYVLLANLIVKYICAGIDKKTIGGVSANKELRLIVLFITYICMWFMMPDFAEVVIWPSGCITYMWMNLIILSFGYLYYKEFVAIKNGQETQSRKVLLKRILGIIGYVLFGLCAGWSAEASAGATIGGIFLFFVWCLLTKHKIGLEKICGFVGCCLGYCLLIFSPANRIRITDAGEGTLTKGWLETYAYRIVRESYYLFILLLIPIAISISLYILSQKRSTFRKEGAIKTIIREIAKGEEAFFWLIAFASVYVMTFSAGFANRIFQFPLLLLIIAIGKSFIRIFGELEEGYKKRLCNATRALCVMLMLLALIEVVAGVFYSKAHDSFFDRQMIYYNIYETQGIMPNNVLEK